MNRTNVIAVAASLAINAGVLLGIASGIEQSSLPRGQVIVTELEEGGPAPLLASSDLDRGTIQAVAL